MDKVDGVNPDPLGQEKMKIEKLEAYKTLLESRTVWGGIIAIFAGVGGLFGLVLEPEAQTGLVDAAAGVGAAIGGAVAIVGRIQATKRIRRR